MCSRNLLIIILILCIIFLALTSAKEEIYRLPKNVKPIRYILTIEPFVEENYYNGSVIIEIETSENTNSLTFHEHKLNIDNSDIKIVNLIGENLQINNVSENSETETYTILLQNELEKGKSYNLTIENFSGNFRHKKGFLLKRAHDIINERYAIAVATHFEPTGARSAFPCFDEPALKAKFLINLIRNEGYLSVSNEAMEKTEDLGNGRFKDTFKETPIMPTYTVAFIVTNFTYSKTADIHRIFGPPQIMEKGEFDQAQDVGVKALKALEEYTGINYTLSKIDQFAIPNFPIPGMENWGLIIYKESTLRIKNSSDPYIFQGMTEVVSHEFAHQWFGNLVTPEWWDYLWLSESFSSYFQYHISSLIQPSWKLMEQMITEIVMTALQEEEFTKPGALNDPIPYSGAIPELHIMYPKGSAILRMTDHFLTPEIFRKGIQIYLQNNKFSSAVPKDLYNAFQTAVDNEGANNLLGNLSVVDILTTWDSTKGFPIVTVTRNYTTGAITLKQHSSSSKFPRKIPINFIFSSSNKINFSKTVADYWLTEENATIEDNFPADGWVMVNIQMTGYYRVNYDLENWERIIQFFNSDNNFTFIHVINRAQLIGDSFNLAYNKLIPWHIPLRLSEYLLKEREYVPIATFCQFAKPHVKKLFERSFEDEVNFEKYVLGNLVSEKNVTAKKLSELYSKNVLSGIRTYLGRLRKPEDTHLDRLTRMVLRF